MDRGLAALHLDVPTNVFRSGLRNLTLLSDSANIVNFSIDLLPTALCSYYD